MVYISGGWKLKAESRLTLRKEDTTIYHLFIFFKDRVSTAAVKQYEMLQINKLLTSCFVLTSFFVLFPLRSRDEQESST